MEISEVKKLHIAYLILITLKAVGAIAEIIGSFFILFISPAFVQNAVYIITRGELSENPNDFIANYLVKLAQEFSINAQHFAFIYLLTHGVIKLFLISQLLQRKLWAYPTAILVFFLFIVYQQYRYTHTHSPWLLILSIFDLLVIALTWWEYRRIKKNQEIPKVLHEILHKN